MHDGINLCHLMLVNTGVLTPLVPQTPVRPWWTLKGTLGTWVGQ